tara:strand:+ start:132 stop:425 length:294 start_codon:yes stop_codon:yes gene_type:complete
MTNKPTTTMFAGDIIAFNLDIKEKELKAAEAIEERCSIFLAAYNANPFGVSETVTGPGKDALKTAAVKMKNAALTIGTLRGEIETLKRNLASAMRIF